MKNETWDQYIYLSLTDETGKDYADIQKLSPVETEKIKHLKDRGYKENHHRAYLRWTKRILTKPIKRKPIWVSLAVNDDYGEWAYNIGRVDFDDMCDANPYDMEAQAEVYDDHLYIGYLRLPYIKRQSWLGTMRFEGFLMGRDDAERLAEYLRKRDYKPEYGDSELFNAWNNDLPIKFSN